MRTTPKKALPPLPGKIWDVIRRGRDSTNESTDATTTNLLRDLVNSLRADNERLERENAELRQLLASASPQNVTQSKKPLPVHPGQMVIE